MTRLLGVIALMLGCSAAGDGGIDFVPPLELSPDAELADATEEAAAAWSAATGIPIVLGSRGVSVYQVDGLDKCGNTSTRRYLGGGLLRVDSIELRPPGGRCMQWPGTLRHELGHVLQQWGSRDDFPPDADGHIDVGLMHANAYGEPLIDVPALELICAAAPCTAFVPEY